jgi:hypothetical protein
MIIVSQRPPADLTPLENRTPYAAVLPPASAFFHEGKLNMGPAILLAVILSLIGWAGIIGTSYIIHPLI